MAWVYKDPEVGDCLDEFGGTHVYPDTGQTLAQESPDAYYQIADWRAAIWRISQRFHYFVLRLILQKAK